MHSKSIIHLDLKSANGNLPPTHEGTSVVNQRGINVALDA